MQTIELSHTAGDGNTISQHNVPFLGVRVRTTRASRRAELKRIREEKERAIAKAQLEQEAAAWAAQQELRAQQERQFWTKNISALAELGGSLPPISARRLFANIGCLSAIYAAIGSGACTREEILSAVMKKHRYSYRHSGFLLRKMCGDDPVEHLWFKAEDRTYHLHQSVSRGSELTH